MILPTLIRILAPREAKYTHPKNQIGQQYFSVKFNSTELEVQVQNTQKVPKCSTYVHCTLNQCTVHNACGPYLITRLQITANMFAYGTMLIIIILNS